MSLAEARGSSPPARDAFPSAVKTAIEAAKAMGATNKAIYTGIWLYCISMLIEATDSEDAIGILEEACSNALGQGINVDSALENLDEAAIRIRMFEADVLAQTLSTYVNPIFTAGSQDTSFSFFWYAMGMLQKAWGDHHYRRILSDQILSLTAGEQEAIIPNEPKTLARERKKELPANTPSPPPSPSPSPPVEIEVQVERISRGCEPQRFVVPSIAEARIDIDVGDDDVVYAIVCDIASLDGARRETREITGRISDDTGRQAYLAAALDLLRSLAQEKSSIRIETSSSLLVDGTEDGFGRLPLESDAWSEIDQISSLCDVRWTLQREIMASELGERCDRLLRMEREKEAVR